jgi:hypothetical protein
VVRVALVFLLLLLPSIAHAQKRVALVIGNSAYQHTAKLTNSKNDAIDVAAALKKHGFEVIDGFDLDKAAFDRKGRDFATALKGSDVGLFFYAGHGLQVAGYNYLLPVDAKADGAETLDFEMVRVDVIQRLMEGQTNTNILFLDACRDNPLARNLARSMGTRSSEVGRGLAALESGVGTLISFSTQPGNVALDGAGRNSPFAGSLARHISASNDDLSAVLIAVRNDVMKETQRKQVPWEHSALTGRFFFRQWRSIDEWHVATSSDGQFIVELPGKPRYRAAPLSTGTAPTVTVHMYEFGQGATIYKAGYIVIPKGNVVTAKTRLENALKNGNWTSVNWGQHDGDLSVDATGMKEGNEIRSFSVASESRICTLFRPAREFELC